MHASFPTKPSGFVLVGVVMMVLALTILGLSLFSLSSYEAQFMNRSLDSQQALQCALGGIDRARFVLSSPADTGLGTVKIGLPRDSVLWVRASQPGRVGMPPTLPDSFGPMVAGGPDLIIEATARYRGISRTISGKYMPTQTINYYKRLITVGSGGIWLNSLIPLPVGCGTVLLGPTLPLLQQPDSIWIDPSSPAPPPGSASVASCALAYNITYRIGTPPVPTPSVSQFITDHVGGATIAPFSSTSYYLNGSPGTISYWYTEKLSDPDFSIRTNLDLDVQVNGLAVWMIPRGLRTDATFTIRSGGDPNACLVIVARDGHDSNFGGLPGAIWPFAGFTAQIPVIFVTDGSVKLETNNQPGNLTIAPHVSIFANHVELTGPANSSIYNPFAHTMLLQYGATVMDPIIDRLMDAGALPNSVGRPLALRPGTWHDSQ